MRRGLLVIVLGIGLLILLTWLGTFITTFVPHRTTPQSQTTRVGPYEVTLRVDPNPPPVTRPTALAVQVLLASSRQPVSNLRVVVDSAMETMDMGSERAEAQARGNGLYSASVQFSMSGPWQVQVILTAPNSSSLNASFEIMTA